MTNNMNDDLRWLAFRYLASELDDDEQVEFEKRLADDQAARETVAEMVSETRLLAAACQPSKVERIAKPMRLDWSAAMIGLGSCLALLLTVPLSRGLTTSSIPQQELAKTTDSLSTNPAELAFAWAVTRHEAGDEDEFLISFEPLHSDDETSSEDDFTAPSWMLAAIATMDGNDSDLKLQE